MEDRKELLWSWRGKFVESSANELIFPSSLCLRFGLSLLLLRRPKGSVFCGQGSEGSVSHTSYMDIAIDSVLIRNKVMRTKSYI